MLGKRNRREMKANGSLKGGADATIGQKSKGNNKRRDIVSNSTTYISSAISCWTGPPF